MREVKSQGLVLGVCALHMLGWHRSWGRIISLIVPEDIEYVCLWYLCDPTGYAPSRVIELVVRHTLRTTICDEYRRSRKRFQTFTGEWRFWADRVIVPEVKRLVWRVSVTLDDASEVICSASSCSGSKADTFVQEELFFTVCSWLREASKSINNMWR
jgi:hypothetical protein